jgi:hypothetical protein
LAPRGALGWPAGQENSAFCGLGPCVPAQASPSSVSRGSRSWSKYHLPEKRTKNPKREQKKKKKKTDGDAPTTPLPPARQRLTNPPPLDRQSCAPLRAHPSSCKTTKIQSRCLHHWQVRNPHAPPCTLVITYAHIRAYDTPRLMRLGSHLSDRPPLP